MERSDTRTARDLMTDVFAFPHIPYWFTLRQSVGILKNSLLKEGSVDPPVVLVFDEKYNLVGMLTLDNLLKRIGPLFAESAGAAAVPGPAEKWTDQPVGTLLVPAKTFVEPETSLAETARIFVAAGLPLLPVLEHRKKLVGVVRARELFRELVGQV